jgi:hypothetical protein
MYIPNFTLSVPFEVITTFKEVGFVFLEFITCHFQNIFGNKIFVPMHTHLEPYVSPKNLKQLNYLAPCCIQVFQGTWKQVGG